MRINRNSTELRGSLVVDIQVGMVNNVGRDLKNPRNASKSLHVNLLMAGMAKMSASRSHQDKNMEEDLVTDSLRIGESNLRSLQDRSMGDLVADLKSLDKTMLEANQVEDSVEVHMGNVRGKKSIERSSRSFKKRDERKVVDGSPDLIRARLD